MRWERMLVTGGSLVLSGHQLILKTPGPAGPGVEDVTWWSDSQVSTFLERFALGGFSRTGTEGQQLARHLSGRRRPPWATAEVATAVDPGQFSRRVLDLLAQSPQSFRAAWEVEVALPEVRLSRGGEVLATLRCASAAVVDLHGDRPDAALVSYAALRLSAARGVDLVLRTHASGEHAGRVSDPAAGQTQLRLLGVELPLSPALDWFPIHLLGLSGDLRSQRKEGVTIIDF